MKNTKRKNGKPTTVNKNREKTIQRKSTQSRQSQLESYNLLIRNFPLRPLRSEAQYERAVKVAEELLDRFHSLTKSERDYFDVLDYLIGDYEERIFAEDYIDFEPRQLIQSLMEANGLRQSDLVPLFGSRSRVSEFLSGKRDLSVVQIQALCQRFNLKAEALLPKLKKAAI